jgi:hypothetical protein
VAGNRAILFDVIILTAHHASRHGKKTILSAQHLAGSVTNQVGLLTLNTVQSAVLADANEIGNGVHQTQGPEQHGLKQHNATGPGRLCEKQLPFFFEVASRLQPTRAQTGQEGVGKG